jgi:hypothetical protein
MPSSGRGRLALAALCWLSALAATSAEPSRVNNEADLREAEAYRQERISGSKNHFVCEGIGVLDLGAATDGPLYYFNDSSRQLISVCGGACWHPRTESQTAMCANLCPPPQWKTNSCDEKRKAFYVAKLPDVTEVQARAKAASFSGCNNRRADCEINGRFENNQWVFDIVYLSFKDKAMEDWVRRFGMSRVVVNIKGHVVEYRELAGRDR